MLFRKEIIVDKNQIDINHSDKILLLGSCFSHNIYNKLKESAFSASQPFGTLYNPITIVNNLLRIISKTLYTTEDVIKSNNTYYSWHHSGTTFSNSKDNLLEDLNNELLLLNTELNESKYIIITLGSAFVYNYKDFGIVGNCHKIPANNFEKRLLSIDEIVEKWNSLLAKLKNKQIILTVSPVRHWSDGSINNTLSKSILHLAINKIIQHNSSCFYFPSYEIILDELRDYRFYKSDMLHPTNQAIDYVWLKFKHYAINNKNQSLINKISAIKKSLLHKPFNSNSEQYKIHLINTLDSINNIKSLTPKYDWKEEISFVNINLQ